VVILLTRTNKQWVDRKRGVAGFFASQIMPNGDEVAARLSAKFQMGAYAAASASS
jgi:hypothetical protein